MDKARKVEQLQESLDVMESCLNLAKQVLGRCNLLQKHKKKVLWKWNGDRRAASGRADREVNNLDELKCTGNISSVLPHASGFCACFNALSKDAKAQDAYLRSPRVCTKRGGHFVYLWSEDEDE